MDSTARPNSDETVYDDPQASWLHVSDESFEAMEKMCDKTASDPDSTLYAYMHSDNKHGVVAAAKLSLENGNKPTKACDEEAQALERLLGELSPEEQNVLKDDMFSSVLDVTQLDDIEAPSRLWENTVTNETTLHVSPLKMVGLLRPSTIMEECGEESTGSNISSQISYETAAKETESEVSTSCYHTANDTGASKWDVVNREVKNEDLMTFEDSTDLIDLETIFNDESVELESSSDRSIIEISDDENILEGDKHLEKNSSIQGSSSYESDEKENTLLANQKESPMHFNDTIEEVEYMMKKGMEFMAANHNETHLKPTGNVLKPSNIGVTLPLTPRSPAAQRGVLKSSNTISPSKFFPTAQRDFVNSPVMGAGSPIKINKRVASPSTSSAKKADKNSPFHVRPIPKLDLFKIPSTTVSSSLRNKQFSHVMSPVGLYMKHTSTTPLMSNSAVHRNKTSASSTFRELELESRKYQPMSKCVAANSALSNLVLSLPKKAYISSKKKEIVDGRTEKTIPGGNHIKKYLEQVMLPTVVRHDGKAKCGDKVPSLPQSPGRSQHSLDNLSLMSGDVSLWTIKDAKKL